MSEDSSKASGSSVGEGRETERERFMAVTEKLREIVRLHDEAFDHAMKFDNHHKSSEGQITVHFTNRFDAEREADPLHIKAVEVYSYVLGPSRQHSFDSVDEALATVRKWHHAEMTHDYESDLA